MFFPRDYFASAINPLFSICCNNKGCYYEPPVIEDAMTTRLKRAEENNGGNSAPTTTDASDLSQYNQRNPPQHIKPLLSHMQEKHSRAFCVICYVNKRDYLAVLPRFTREELSKHMKSGGEVL
jgi:hypothetical protein